MELDSPKQMMNQEVSVRKLQFLRSEKIEFVMSQQKPFCKISIKSHDVSNYGRPPQPQIHLTAEIIYPSRKIRTIDEKFCTEFNYAY